LSFTHYHGRKGQFLDGPHRVSRVQATYPVDNEEKLVGQEEAAAYHVGEDSCDIPPLGQKATTGQIVKDPKGQKVLGVYIRVQIEEGAKLGVGVVPGETWSGNSWRYFICVEVRPGLATCGRH